MIKTFTFYSDPSHGWIKVSKSLLIGLNLKPSGFSYVKNNHVYLEEDFDAYRFLDAYCLKNNIERKDLKFHSKWTNKRSKIRGYNTYTE